MKQKDIALILVIVAVSGVVSFLASQWIFARPADRKQKAEVVDVITSDFPLPNTKYFNDKSIDPTQLIEIGNSNNPNPFGGSSQ
jgi:Flp pilus assembly protein CpaB